MLEHPFTSLPSLSEHTPLENHHTSLLDIHELATLPLITYEIDSTDERVSSPPAHCLITDEDIFLDDSPVNSSDSLSLVSGESEGMKPGFDPKHSLFAKVQPNAGRWAKAMIENIKDEHSSSAVVRKEIKQVRKAIASVIEKKVFATIKRIPEKTRSSDKLIDPQSLLARIPKSAPAPRLVPRTIPKAITPQQKPQSNKSFLIKPSTILFKDCVPGKSYKLTLQVQNSTAHIQSYFVDPFHASVSAFLTVQPTASRAVSPGLKWDIEIEFFAAWDMKDDIETRLTLRSSTGISHVIPVFAKLKQESSFVEYCAKKYRFDQAPTIAMNFGVSQIKKIRKMTFSVANDGLFDGLFQIEGVLPVEFKVDTQQVKLKAGEVALFTVSYCPKDADATKACSFKVLHAETGKCVVLECAATLPPKALKVSKTLVDFGACQPNKVYHAEFELFNLQQAALMYDAEICYGALEKTNLNAPEPTDTTAKAPKLQLKNSVYIAALQGEIEIISKRGLIQRNSSSKIKIKFIKHQTRSQDNFEFALPIKFTNEGTGERWVSTLKGSVASTEFVLKRGDEVVPRNVAAYVHLQSHPIFESKIEKYTLFNPSSNPQEFKITVDASFAKVSESVIKLEQYETKSFKVTLTGLLDNVNKFCITVKSTFMSGVFLFAVRGISPAVYFTNSFLKFEPITLSGSRELTTKICFNTHTDPEEDFEYEFTFDSPTIVSSKIEEVGDTENKWSYLDTQKCPLRVYPNQALLQTSDMITLKILASPAVIPNGFKDFKSSSSQMDLADSTNDVKKNKAKEAKPAAKPAAKPDPKVAVKKEVEVAVIVENKVDKSMQLLHAKLDSFKNTALDCVVMCRVKRYPSEKLLLKRLLEVITEDDAKMKEVEETIQLHVSLPIIRPDYYFMEDKDSSKRTPFKIDFGRVIIGERVTKSVSFKMISMCAINAALSGLDSSIISFPNLGLLNQESENLIIACCPNSTETKEVTCEFKSEYTSVFVVICMEAFSPKIDVSAQSLTYPDTLVGETFLQTVSITNPGDYPISVSLKVMNSDAHSINALAEVVIQPLATLDVAVAFKPLYATLCVDAELFVTYVGQKEVQMIALIGRGCDTTVSVTGFDTGKQVALLRSSSIEFEIVDNYLNDISIGAIVSPAPKEKKSVPYRESVTSSKDTIRRSDTLVDKTKSYRYALFTCPNPDFCITNLKSNAKVDPLAKKYNSTMTYTVELFNGTYYADDGGHIVITERAARVFHSIELTTGVLEIGQSKKFTVKKVEGIAAEVGEDVVSFYKITIVGGLRVTEPKCAVAPEEPTIYILKVVDAEVLIVASGE